MNPLAQIMGKQAMGNMPQMQMIQQFQYRMTTNKPEHSDVLAFYDVETKTIIENRGASETAKVIQLLPDRIR